MANKMKLNMNYYLRNKLDDEMDEEVFVLAQQNSNLQHYGREERTNEIYTLSTNRNESVEAPRHRDSSDRTEGYKTASHNTDRPTASSYEDRSVVLSDVFTTIESCEEQDDEFFSNLSFPVTERMESKPHCVRKKSPSVSAATQTTSSWNSAASVNGLTDLQKRQEEYISSEEQLARRLFLTRRCWSFMSKRGERYKRSFPQTSSRGPCDCNSNSNILNQLKVLQSQNSILQEQISQLSQKVGARSQQYDSSLGSAIEKILAVEKERKELMDMKMAVLQEERDTALKQLNEVIDILLQPNVVLDRSDSESESQEHDEVVYEVMSRTSATRNIAVNNVDLIKRIDQLQINLEYETRLRLSSEKKLNRVMKIINALQEKVAVFHSSAEW